MQSIPAIIRKLHSSQYKLRKLITPHLSRPHTHHLSRSLPLPQQPFKNLSVFTKASLVLSSSHAKLGLAKERKQKAQLVRRSIRESQLKISKFFQQKKKRIKEDQEMDKLVCSISRQFFQSKLKKNQNLIMAIKDSCQNSL